MPRSFCLTGCIALIAICSDFLSAQESTIRPTELTALRKIKSQVNVIRETNRAIWEFAELGLEEHKSSALLQDHLRAAGFDVETGLAGMPTAFVATYGSGKPVIGLLAEFDALPDLSQKISSEREPIQSGKPGHGCGHCGLGAGAMGAASGIREAIEKHQLRGTLKVFGTPAEETTIGKVYMQLAGNFDDLDVCLHWHPSTKNEVWNGGSKALVSAKFTFEGTAAHASGSPDQGRSGLDGVELMNVGVNYLREHMKENARIHYVITEGGGAPNVVPPRAQVWYYVRADDHKDAEFYFNWVHDIAKGASLMSRTKMSYVIDTDCHEIIPNTPLAEAMLKNLHKLNPPKFNEDEIAFARRLQQSLTEEFGRTYTIAIDEKIHPLPAIPEPGKGSTDVGDISWHVPTIGLRTACFVHGSPGHSWQNVAAIGTSIGEKGVVYASQVLACMALELFESEELRAAARKDFRQRMENRPYTTLIPKGQKVPKKIR